MMSHLRASFVFTAMLALGAAQAQQIVKATLGTSNSTFLLGNTQALRSQCLYLPADLVNPVSGNITRLYYRYGTTSQGTGVMLGNLAIRMGITNEVAFAGGDTYFTGLQQVLSVASFTIPPGTTGAWFPIDLQTPFAYNPNRTLIIEIEFETTTAQAFGTYGTTPNNGRKLYSGTSGTATGNTTSTTWQDLGFDLDTGTGIAHVESGGAAIWPNPARDQVMVRLPVDDVVGIEAIGSDGRVARTWTAASSGLLALDLGGLAPGIYTIRTRSEVSARTIGTLVKD